MRTVKIHFFKTSTAAYDTTQCNTEVRNGDVLMVEAEGVIGVAHTWPVAVTKSFGELHAPNAGVSWADFLKAYENEPDMLEGFRLARALAVGLDLPVCE